MVSDDSFTPRCNNDQQTDDTPDRGQVILIGAITLAFIILGVVVIFNGVLYTETLSSADTGQSATTAEKTELEITQGIGCLLEKTEGDSSQVEENITAFAGTYQNSTAHSSPTAVHIDVTEGDIYPGENATVDITYDSTDLSYEQNRTIEAGCPS
ncbi:hypothetical protein [Natronorubrum tibetense]|uniref:Uncharacterized protein n=1 Tax=Natronorubrum tibetense GA33 TaxID=1114856 RepID=L9VY90_9EURY|nr:hypothetical protein [Natronorubrum tibetense]ELY42155.1 hypothetical protein C496_07148 [Natronorubrum tibetense GA33]